MKCSKCNYYGYNEDGFPCCLADPHWPAPCEEDDDYEEPDDIDDDFGFDPYEGCYTYDC